MLDVKNISKTFNAGTVNEKVALNGLSLHLDEGDFVTVIGGNGAGKSTLLNAVAGVWPVDSGTIMIDDVDITRLPEHKRAKYIGRVFQDPMIGTAATMQIEENLALAARRGQRRGLGPGITREEQEQYKEQLKMLGLGLESRLTSKVGLLSGGQRQALTLLMASLKKPKLLLLDEHTAALDPKTAAKVLELSAKIVAEHNLTTLMITHNMKDAIQYGNRLIMMHEGRIIYDVGGEEKKNLNEKVTLAAQLDATGITLEAQNKRGKKARKIKDAVKLKIDFTIAKNITAETGERTLYVRIAKPDNSVLTQNSSDTFTYENRQLPYSIKKYIEYNGEEQNVTVYWNVEEYLYAGTYQVYIFTDGTMIGSKEFTLK